MSNADSVPLREHIAELSRLQEKFEQERDRRLVEQHDADLRVDAEREKALRIKEDGDKEALRLAREIQQYKDEKANELREQISSERGMYATKEDIRSLEDKLTTMMSPALSYVTSQGGRSTGLKDYIGYILAAIVIVGFVVSTAVQVR